MVNDMMWIPDSLCYKMFRRDVSREMGIGDKINIGIKTGKNSNNRRNEELDKFYRDKK
jgi:hypothetical protein